MQLNLSSRVDSLEKQLLSKIQKHMKLEGRFLEYFSWQFRKTLMCHGNPMVLPELNTLRFGILAIDFSTGFFFLK